MKKGSDISPFLKTSISPGKQASATKPKQATKPQQFSKPLESSKRFGGSITQAATQEKTPPKAEEQKKPYSSFNEREEKKEKIPENVQQKIKSKNEEIVASKRESKFIDEDTASQLQKDSQRSMKETDKHENDEWPLRDKSQDSPRPKEVKASTIQADQMEDETEKKPNGSTQENGRDIEEQKKESEKKVKEAQLKVQELKKK